MDVALLFLGEDENGLHALEEGGDGAAAQELGASGLIALGGVGPVVDRPAAFKGGKAVGLRLFARLSGSVTTARRLAPNRYFLRATPGPGICSSPLGTRAWRISLLNAAAVRIAVSQWQLSFARRSPGSTSRNLIANFATDVEHVQPAVRYQP